MSPGHCYDGDDDDGDDDDGDDDDGDDGDDDDGGCRLGGLWGREEGYAGEDGGRSAGASNPSQVGSHMINFFPFNEENEHLCLQLNITWINFWLRLFQKVDQWMNKDEQMDNEARKKLDDANQVFRTGRYHQILLSW